MTVGAWASYEQAKRRFDRDVSKATAAKRLEETDRAGRVDQLTPALIDFLAAAWKVEILELDHAARWTRRPTEAKIRASRNMREEIEADLEEALELRGLGDLDAITSAWGQTAVSHAEDHGYRMDVDSPEFAEYVRVLHDATIESWQSILRRLRGEDVPTPELPPAPGKTAEGPAGKSFEAIVETLLDSPRNPISATTREGVRTALRLFRETHGTPAPDEITRAMVAEWLDLLVQRPAKIAKEERGIPLRQLVERYKPRQDAPRLSPKTVAQHLSMLAARWPQALRRGMIPYGSPNPFGDHDLDRTVRPAEPKGFTVEELRAIFGLPIWTGGERPLGGKGEASYWLPLMLLWTGARPEEIAQLIVEDVLKDPQSGRWLLRITDEGVHPVKGQQTLKTRKHGTGRRIFPVPQPLIDLGLLKYVDHLKAHEETALFPQLRVKSARNLLFAGFGDWWGGYLKANGVHLEGEGRQPARELRHTWSTRARECEVSREAMAYIQGHALSDEMAGDGYGSQSPLGRAIARFDYDWFSSVGVWPWKAPRA